MRSGWTRALGHGVAVAALIALVAPAEARAIDFTPAQLAELKAGGTVRRELPSSRKGGFAPAP